MNGPAKNEIICLFLVQLLCDFGVIGTHVRVDIEYTASANEVKPSLVTDCPPGRYVRANATASSDRQCADCGQGVFSTGANTVACIAWSECDTAQQRKPNVQYACINEAIPQFLMQCHASLASHATPSEMNMERSIPAQRQLSLAPLRSVQLTPLTKRPPSPAPLRSLLFDTL